MSYGYGYYSGSYGYSNYFGATVYLDLDRPGQYVNVSSQEGSFHYGGIAYESYDYGKYYSTTYADSSGSYDDRAVGHIAPGGDTSHSRTLYDNGVSYYEGGYLRSYHDASGTTTVGGLYEYFHSAYGATTTYSEQFESISSLEHSGSERSFETTYTAPDGQSYYTSGSVGHL